LLPTFGAELQKLPAYSTAKRVRAYAVVIGIEKYRDVPDAAHAAGDAQMAEAYLQSALGVPPENTKVLINSRATRSDVESAIEVWLKNQLESEPGIPAQVFVYYSGHGSPQPATGEAFLVPYDGNPDTIEKSGYPLNRLYASLAGLPKTSSLVILDSCFSGAGDPTGPNRPRTLIAKGSRPLVPVLENPAISGSMAVLSASKASQISGSYEDKASGLFTYFLLRGLQGEADSNKDKKITLKELFAYLRPEVVRQARKDNREQEPQLSPPGGGPWEGEALAVVR
jgi:uncharacterized caspase-like protein